MVLEAEISKRRKGRAGEGGWEIWRVSRFNMFHHFLHLHGALFFVASFPLPPILPWRAPIKRIGRLRGVGHIYLLLFFASECFLWYVRIGYVQPLVTATEATEHAKKRGTGTLRIVR